MLGQLMKLYLNQWTAQIWLKSKHVKSTQRNHDGFIYKRSTCQFLSLSNSKDLYMSHRMIIFFNQFNFSRQQSQLLFLSK